MEQEAPPAPADQSGAPAGLEPLLIGFVCVAISISSRPWLELLRCTVMTPLVDLECFDTSFLLLLLDVLSSDLVPLLF